MTRTNLKVWLIPGILTFFYVERDKNGVSSIKGSQSSPGTNLMQFFEDEFITQSVTESTFRQANGKNVFDYVLSDMPERIINGSSAQTHHSITCEISYNLKTTVKKVSKSLFLIRVII